MAPVVVDPDKVRALKTKDAFYSWLKANHQKQTELWVRMYKKGSGVKSVAWEDCVLACLTWGWIDGQRRALDEVVVPLWADLRGA